MSSDLGSRTQIGVRSAAHILNPSETSRLSGQALFMVMAEDQEGKTKCKRTFQVSTFVMSTHITFAKASDIAKSTRSLREVN